MVAAIVVSGTQFIDDFLSNVPSRRNWAWSEISRWRNLIIAVVVVLNVDFFLVKHGIGFQYPLQHISHLKQKESTLSSELSISSPNHTSKKKQVEFYMFYFLRKTVSVVTSYLTRTFLLSKYHFPDILILIDRDACFKITYKPVSVLREPRVTHLRFLILDGAFHFAVYLKQNQHTNN